MNRPSLVSLCLLLGSSRAVAQAVDEGQHPVGTLEVVAAFRGPGPSGIAVTPGGRIFVGFPRHAENHAGMTLGELKDGRLVPYPSAALSEPSGAEPLHRLLSVHGMTIDGQGRLWVIDDGKEAGHAIPEGGAKVVGIDPATDQVFARIPLEVPARLADSHLNDLRVDLTHGSQGTVYIADSSFGTAPALVVVDVATGRQRRVLGDHPSIRPESGFVTHLDGRPLRYTPQRPTFPAGGVDGLELSADRSRLYYTPLTSRRLYSLPTALLADPKASEAALARAVRDEGEKGMTDGMAADARGRLYLTDAEHDGILRRDTDGALDVVVRDPRLVWPDGVFVTERFVYVTLGQWSRLPDFHSGRDLRQPPYLLIRAPIDAAPEPSAQP